MNTASMTQSQSTRRLSALALSLALAASITTGCSKNSDDTAQGGGTGRTSSGAAAAAGADQSQQVLASAKEATPIATTNGTLVDGRDSYNVKLEIFELRRQGQFTVLSYKISNEKNQLTGITARSWNKQPTLTPKGSDQMLQPISVFRPGIVSFSLGGPNPCFCTGYSGTKPNVGPQNVLYGPLPESVTDVEIAMGPKLKINATLS